MPASDQARATTGSGFAPGLSGRGGSGDRSGGSSVWYASSPGTSVHTTSSEDAALS